MVLPVLDVLLGWSLIFYYQQVLCVLSLSCPSENEARGDDCFPPSLQKEMYAF